MNGIISNEIIAINGIEYAILHVSDKFGVSTAQTNKAISSWQILVYKRDDFQKNNIAAENIVAFADALPFIADYACSEEEETSWIITLFEVLDERLRHTNLGAQLLEKIISYLRMKSSEGSDVYLSAPNNSVYDAITEYGLWSIFEGDAEIPDIHTRVCKISEIYSTEERARVVLEINGFHSLREDMLPPIKETLIEGYLECDTGNKDNHFCHCYKVTFNSSYDSRQVGTLQFTVTTSIVRGKVLFEIVYNPSKTGKFEELCRFGNYSEAICNAIEKIARIYKNPENIVTCYTVEKDIIKGLRDRLWSMMFDFSLEYKFGYTS